MINLKKTKSTMEEKLLHPVGDYQKLLSYQKTVVIYEMTYYFCHQYLERGDRTVDQMIQAARSGKQNIVEGCAASATSAKTELKLMNVAKASLHELREDYLDYLRTHASQPWTKGSPQYEAMRQLGRQHSDAQYFMALCQTRPPETIANMALILLAQADYLLHRHLERLQQDFVEEGGFSERLTRIRRSKRGF
jgi:four helix bundle suffix protein